MESKEKAKRNYNRNKQNQIISNFNIQRDYG